MNMVKIGKQLLFMFVVVGSVSTILRGAEEEAEQQPMDLMETEEQSLRQLLTTVHRYPYLSQAWHPMQQWLRQLPNAQRKEAHLLTVMRQKIREENNLQPLTPADFFENFGQSVALVLPDDYIFNPELVKPKLNTPPTLNRITFHKNGSFVLSGYNRAQNPAFFFYNADGSFYKTIQLSKKQVITTLAVHPHNHHLIAVGTSKGELFIVSADEAAHGVELLTKSETLIRAGKAQCPVVNIRFVGDQTEQVKLVVHFQYLGPGGAYAAAAAPYELTVQYSPDRDGNYPSKPRDYRDFNWDDLPRNGIFSVDAEPALGARKLQLCFDRESVYDVCRILEADGRHFAVVAEDGNAAVLATADNSQLFLCQGSPEHTSRLGKLNLILRHYLAADCTDSQRLCNGNPIYGTYNPLIFAYQFLSYVLYKKRADELHNGVIVAVDSPFKRSILNTMDRNLLRLLNEETYTLESPYDPAAQLLSRARHYVRQHPVETALAVTTAVLTTASVVDRMRRGDWRNTRRQFERMGRGLSGVALFVSTILNTSSGGNS